MSIQSTSCFKAEVKVFKIIIGLKAFYADRIGSLSVPDPSVVGAFVA
jgi:GrpB-like predicted nucleotidyltransferase (UPF0157 family)